MLSDFKHHFILRKIRVPRELSFNDFADELYRVFGKDFALENTIYIVQIVKSHEHHCYDIAVGLRRDADAVKIARDLGQFRLEGYSMEIELAPAFSCFYD